jgi:carbon monoxide dehydrogenase subunit G
MTVIARQVELPAAPAQVFAFLHDPARRRVWDVSAEQAALDREKPGMNARLTVTGRRMAPSWEGRYTVFDPPKRSVVQLSPGGPGLPFRSYTETIELRPNGSGSILRYAIEYQTSGMWKLIEPFTIGSRLRKTVKGSVNRIYDHFLV